MLSENLGYVCDWLGRYRAEGVYLEPEAVDGFVAVLNGAMLDAQALERAIVPDSARRVVDLSGDTVVAFPTPCRGRTAL